MVVEGEISCDNLELGRRDALEITADMPNIRMRKPSKLLAIRVPLLYK